MTNPNLKSLEFKKYLSRCFPETILTKDMDPYNKLKLVVDWISGMTDKYALDVYQKLSGASL